MHTYRMHVPRRRADKDIAIEFFHIHQCSPFPKARPVLPYTFHARHKFRDSMGLSVSRGELSYRVASK